MKALLIIEQVAGHAALAALFYWWLGYAESGVGQFLLSVLCVAVLVSGAVFLAMRARRMLRRGTPPPGWTLPVGALLLVIAAIVGYKLVGWVPAIEGFTGQALSMTARWGLAYALVLLAWLNLLRASQR